jgi:hypothetical protein
VPGFLIFLKKLKYASRYDEKIQIQTQFYQSVYIDGPVYFIVLTSIQVVPGLGKLKESA